MRTSEGMKGVFSLGFYGYSCCYQPYLSEQQLCCCRGGEVSVLVESLLSLSCGPGLENLFLIAACPCDLVSVACLLP